MKTNFFQNILSVQSQSSEQLRELSSIADLSVELLVFVAKLHREVIAKTRLTEREAMTLIAHTFCLTNEQDAQAEQTIRVADFLRNELELFTQEYLMKFALESVLGMFSHLKAQR